MDFFPKWLKWKLLIHFMGNIWSIEGSKMETTQEIKPIRKSRAEVPVPELRIFRNLVDHIQNQRNRVLIELLYLTAGRVSEIVSKTSAPDLKYTKLNRKN